VRMLTPDWLSGQQTIQTEGQGRGEGNDKSKR
jgi:hypothetical protein